MLEARGGGWEGPSAGLLGVQLSTAAWLADPLLLHRKTDAHKTEFSTSVPSDLPNFTDAKARRASQAIAPSFVTFMQSMLDVWR
jgi:hypothetical protein